MLSRRSRDDRGAYAMFIAIVAGALVMFASVAYDVPRLITARQHAAQTAQEAARVAAATFAAGGTLEEAQAAAADRVGAFPQPYGAAASLGPVRCVGDEVETTLLTTYDNKSALGIFRDTQFIQASGAARAAIIGPGGAELTLGALPQCPRDLPNPTTLVPLAPKSLCVESYYPPSNGDRQITLQWDDTDIGTVTRYEYQARYSTVSGNESYNWGPWLAATTAPANEFTVTKVQVRHSNNTVRPEEFLRNDAEYRFRVRAVNDAPDAGPGVLAPTRSPWFVRATPDDFTNGNINNKDLTTPRCGASPAKLTDICISAVGHNSVTFRPYGPTKTPPNNAMPDSSIFGFAYTIRLQNGGFWPTYARPLDQDSRFFELPGDSHDTVITVTHTLHRSESKLDIRLLSDTIYRIVLRGYNTKGEQGDNSERFVFLTASDETTEGRVIGQNGTHKHLQDAVCT